MSIDMDLRAAPAQSGEVGRLLPAAGRASQVHCREAPGAGLLEAFGREQALATGIEGQVEQSEGACRRHRFCAPLSVRGRGRGRAEGHEHEHACEATAGHAATLPRSGSRIIRSRPLVCSRSYAGSAPAAQGAAFP
jgi:hypothetical protein